MLHKLKQMRPLAYLIFSCQGLKLQCSCCSKKPCELQKNYCLLQICCKTSVAVEFAKTFSFSCRTCQKTVQILTMQFKERDLILSEHSMASMSHSHSGLSCLGNAALLTMLKVTYCQAGDESVNSSINVDSWGFDLSDTDFRTVLGQLFGIKYCSFAGKQKEKKSIYPQLEDELKCQNQYLFLKCNQCPQTCNFRILSHHLVALHNTYTCTVTISNKLEVQISNSVGQANRTPSSSHNTFQTRCNACKNANAFKFSNFLQQHVNEVFSAWVPKQTDYRMKNLSNMFSTK